jgi:hypothetical protein
MNATAQRAAAKIVELINSHPRTPMQQEIAAIIAQTAADEVGATSCTDAAALRHLLAEWENAVEAAIAADAVDDSTDRAVVKVAEAEMNRIDGVIAELAQRIWARPVAASPSPSEVKLRAELAEFYSDLGPEAASDLEWVESACFQERAIHELIVAALRFGEDGRRA